MMPDEHEDDDTRDEDEMSRSEQLKALRLHHARLASRHRDESMGRGADGVGLGYDE